MVTECSYIFNYKDHWESRIVFTCHTITRIFLIQDYIINFSRLCHRLHSLTSSCQLSRCVFRPVLGCLVFDQHLVAQYLTSSWLLGIVSQLARRCSSCLITTHIYIQGQILRQHFFLSLVQALTNCKKIKVTKEVIKSTYV